jgi:hypothetical protein
MLAKPDIPQEDVNFLSNELVKVVCDTLCNGTNCSVKANTTSIEGLMSTPFYVTIIEIPSQTKENIKLLKEKCKSVVKQYDKLHKSRLSWSIDIEKKKTQPKRSDVVKCLTKPFSGRGVALVQVRGVLQYPRP